MSNTEDHTEWKIVGKSNKSSIAPIETTLSPQEMDKKNEERKLRRARAKEAKRIRKEEQKRLEMLAPKDSKITVVRALPTKKLENRSEKLSWKLENELFPSLNSNQTIRNLSSPSPKATSTIINEPVSKPKAQATPVPPNLEPSAKLVKKKIGQPLMVEFDPVVKVKQSSLKKLKVTSSKILKNNNLITKTRNKLDSSAPVHLGKKQKMSRKKKRPGKLKRIILKEKLLRRAQRESDKLDSDETTLVAPPISEDITPNQLVNVNVIQEVHAHQNVSTTGRNNTLKPTIHSRKFRDYCDHMLNNELDEYVGKMVKDIIRWQDRAHAENPIKAKANRRYVLGLKETKKLVALSHIKLVIIASDLEPIKSEGGLDDIIAEIKSSAQQRSIPVIFSHTKWKLGYITFRKTPVACIGIINYDGSNENFNRIKNLIPVLKEDYKKKAGISSSNVSKEDYLKENIPLEESSVDSLNKKMLELLKL